MGKIAYNIDLVTGPLLLDELGWRLYVHIRQSLTLFLHSSIQISNNLADKCLSTTLYLHVGGNVVFSPKAVLGLESLLQTKWDISCRNRGSYASVDISLELLHLFLLESFN